MTARALRDAGRLWPQVLTDAELAHELEAAQVSVVPAPISLPMLRAEVQRRKLEKGRN